MWGGEDKGQGEDVGWMGEEVSGIDKKIYWLPEWSLGHTFKLHINNIPGRAVSGGGGNERWKKEGEKMSTT